MTGKDISSEDKKGLGTKKDLSFKKSERLLSPSDFERIRKTGKRLHTRSLRLFVATNGLKTRRIGLAVSSKVADSVRRNRVKRLIRESFRLHKDLFPEGVDILISVKDVSMLCSMADAAEELLTVFKKTADDKRR